MSGQANWGGYEIPAAPARSRRAGWWNWGVILVLIFTLALAAGCAGKPAAREGKTLIAGDLAGDWVRIFDEPCPEAPAWLRFRRAEIFYQGKNYAACWLQAEEHVLVFDDAGDLSDLPIYGFRKDEPL